MYDFNKILLDLPIRLVAAQHLEGGPEAQLYARYGDWTIDAVGSYETGFYESDANDQSRKYESLAAFLCTPQSTRRHSRRGA